MKQLLILATCIACCLATSLSQRRHEALERERESRLIALELDRDQRGVPSPLDLYEEEELNEREFAEPSSPFERHHKLARRDDVIPNCIQGDIVFLIDSSGSIKIENWQFVLNFVNDIIDKMGVGPQKTQVGVCTFGNKAHVIFNLNNYTDPAQMKAAVSSAKFLDENTNTSGGIWMANKVMFTPENGDRKLAPNMLIIITDGVSTYDHEKTIPYANEAKAAGIKIVSLGVGNVTSKDELDAIASVGPNGTALTWQVGSYAVLQTVKDTLANVACQTDNCPGTQCTNRCQYGFQQDKNQCATCTCLPAPSCYRSKLFI